MLRTSLWLLALSTALTAAGASQAQTLQAIELRDTAVLEAWYKTSLTVRRALFVSARPDGFGQYVARTSNVFKPGEKLVAYVEPVGYGWKEKGKESFDFGFEVDSLIKSSDGKLLGGQENFAKVAQNSHVRNREFMLTLTMSLDGAPPGDYVLQYKLRDATSEKSTLVSLPFKIAQ